MRDESRGSRRKRISSISQRVAVTVSVMAFGSVVESYSCANPIRALLRVYFRTSVACTYVCRRTHPESEMRISPTAYRIIHILINFALEIFCKLKNFQNLINIESVIISMSSNYKKLVIILKIDLRKRYRFRHSEKDIRHQQEHFFVPYARLARTKSLSRVRSSLVP